MENVYICPMGGIQFSLMFILFTGLITMFVMHDVTIINDYLLAYLLTTVNRIMCIHFNVLNLSKQ